MEFHQSQRATVIFLENVKVDKLAHPAKPFIISHISILLLITKQPNPKFVFLNKQLWKGNFYVLWRGYIQETDNKAACLKAEAICLDISPCKKVTKQHSKSSQDSSQWKLKGYTLTLTLNKSSMYSRREMTLFKMSTSSKADTSMSCLKNTYYNRSFHL